jgi:hypothetical protein
VSREWLDDAGSIESYRRAVSESVRLACDRATFATFESVDDVRPDAIVTEPRGDRVNADAHWEALESDVDCSSAIRFHVSEIEHAATLAERERCAKECERLGGQARSLDGGESWSARGAAMMADMCAQVIRKG